MTFPTVFLFYRYTRNCLHLENRVLGFIAKNVETVGDNSFSRSHTLYGRLAELLHVIMVLVKYVSSQVV